MTRHKPERHFMVEFTATNPSIRPRLRIRRCTYAADPEEAQNLTYSELRGEGYQRLMIESCEQSEECLK